VDGYPRALLFNVHWERAFAHVRHRHDFFELQAKRAPTSSASRAVPGPTPQGRARFILFFNGCRSGGTRRGVGLLIECRLRGARAGSACVWWEAYGCAAGFKAAALAVLLFLLQGERCARLARVLCVPH
jgi:hypothetical protein